MALPLLRQRELGGRPRHPLFAAVRYLLSRKFAHDIGEDPPDPFRPTR